MKRGLAILSLLLVFLAWWLYSPLPDNVEEPWKVRLLIAAQKLHNILIIPSTFLYGENPLPVIRFMTDVFFRLAARDLAEDRIKVTNTKFGSVPVRIYEPKIRKFDLLPGFVYYHGGGFIMLSIDSYDRVLRQLCNDGHIVIVAVEYRLSPEHPFPIPLDDCIEATKYFILNPHVFAVNPEKIGVGGDSAGGHLAAAATYKMIYELSLPVKFQVLVYPNMQSLDFRTPSMLNYTHFADVILTRSQVAWAFTSYWKGKDGTKYMNDFLQNKHTTKEFRNRYRKFVNRELLPEEYRTPDALVESETNINLAKEFESTLSNPLFTPLFIEDLSKIPSTLIIVAEYDVLRDDGLMFARRLQDAGRPVRFLYRIGGFHAMMSFSKLNVGQETLMDVWQFIRSDH